MLWVISKFHFLGMIEQYPLGALPSVNYLHVKTLLKRWKFWLFFPFDIEMKCNWREQFKQLFLILVATRVHYHTLSIFVITHQVMGVQDDVAGLWRKHQVELRNLRDGKKSAVSHSALPGLRPMLQRTLSAAWCLVGDVVMWPLERPLFLSLSKQSKWL